MTIVELLLHPGLRPFEVAVGIVAALLVFEIVANQLGISLLGESDADADLDLDMDMDVDLDLEVDFDALPDAEFEFGETDLEALEPVDGETIDVEAGSGVLSWLGIGRVPMIIWMTGILTAFGLTGYFVQLGSLWLLGAPVNAWLASAVALVPALALGGWTARQIGRLFPKSESSAISRRSYGKRRGVITVGTARHDKPAQARFVDGYGNFHYAMVIPMDANEEIPQGSEVAIFRGRDGVLKAVNLTK